MVKYENINKKIIENDDERDPRIANSEARKFLAFLNENNGYGANSKVWQNIFSEYNQKVAEVFIYELISGGWIKKIILITLIIGYF
jgi:hypothetical protein